MSKIAAYIRVSTEEQKEEGSHRNQAERIEKWAETNGYDDVGFFQDIAISGQSDEREAYHELMNRYDEFEAVVVRELSRFGRDPLTVMQDVEDIIESDTDFISISEDFDTSSAMGRAFLRILSVINGMYADLRREQAIRTAERRKEEGLPVGRARKLADHPGLREEVFDLRTKGVSYSAIGRIIEDKPTGPDEISKSTIMRECKNAGVEPGGKV